MAREERLPGRSLFESERRFRLLVEGVIDYAIYMLDPDGIITNWNAGAKRIKGYDAEEVLGRHFGMFYLPEDREAGLPERALQTARDTGKFEAEGWRLRKDGTRFLASVVIDALYENGELVGFAKITRDITERSIAAEAAQGERQAFPPAGERRYRLRALHARSDRDRSPTGIPAANASRATSPRKSSDSTFPVSTRQPTRPPAGPLARCGWRSSMAVTRKRDGVFARTERCSGRA